MQFDQIYKQSTFQIQILIFAAHDINHTAAAVAAQCNFLKSNNGTAAIHSYIPIHTFFLHIKTFAAQFTIYLLFNIYIHITYILIVSRCTKFTTTPPADLTEQINHFHLHAFHPAMAHIMLQLVQKNNESAFARFDYLYLYIRIYAAV